MYIYSSYKLILPDYPLIYLGILRKSIPQINNGSDNLDKWMMYGYASHNISLLKSCASFFIYHVLSASYG